MALHVLAYKLTRVMNMMGVQPLLAAKSRQIDKMTKDGYLTETAKVSGRWDE
jgi:hypothetical protein